MKPPSVPVTSWYKYVFVRYFFNEAFIRLCFTAKNLILSLFQQINLVSNEKKNFFKDEKILCPGYEVNKICFCNVFHKQVLHMVVFFLVCFFVLCRNLFSNLIKEIKLVNNITNNLTKVKPASVQVAWFSYNFLYKYKKI